MKNRIIFITIFFLVGALIIYIVTKSPIEKWTYDLPNDYAIKKTSTTNVVLGKYINNLFEVDNNDNQVGITDYIVEFCYGKQYIVLKCFVPVNETYEIRYYIIDSIYNNLYGPYLDEEIYEAVAEKIISEELGNWIETIEMPKGAIDK